MNNYIDITDIVGKVIKEVIGLEEGSEEVFIETECGTVYKFYHDQDCCENVRLYDYEAGSDDMSGALIISAEEVTSTDSPPIHHDDSWLWTFYKIETTKGEIWMRWLGESNGYYSESIGIIKYRSFTNSQTIH